MRLRVHKHKDFREKWGRECRDLTIDIMNIILTHSAYDCIVLEILQACVRHFLLVHSVCG